MRNNQQYIDDLKALYAVINQAHHCVSNAKQNQSQFYLFEQARNKIAEEISKLTGALPSNADQALAQTNWFSSTFTSSSQRQEKRIENLANLVRDFLPEEQAVESIKPQPK